MKTTGNTILITGSSAGMGLEMARLFAENGNTVIITGRDKARLEKAAASLGNVAAILFDVSNANDVQMLAERIDRDFPDLNVLINNAGKAFVHNLSSGRESFENAEDEMMTNYLAMVRLTEKLLPVLQRQTEAAVLNVSSIVAFVPSANLPTYSASKAAVHSYTQSLRLSLSDSNIKVFELMPPLVNTQLSAAIGGEKGIAPSVVAADVLDAFANDRFEIRTGQTEDIYRFSLADPAGALAAMNS